MYISDSLFSLAIPCGIACACPGSAGEGQRMHAGCLIRGPIEMRLAKETRTPTSLRSNSPVRSLSSSSTSSQHLSSRVRVSPRPPRLRLGTRVQHLSTDQETARRRCADAEKQSLSIDIRD